MKKMIDKFKKAYLYAGVIATPLLVPEVAYANDVSNSISNIGQILQGIRSILPVGAQVAGFIMAAGGIYEIRKAQKSQGRDGSETGGVIILILGVALFALGSIIKWVASGTGVGTSGTLPP